MILHENYAVCAGCGAREQVEGEEHPARWPSINDVRLVDLAELKETGHITARYFCSRACLSKNSDGLTVRPQRLPLGLTTRDVQLLYLVAQGYSNQELAQYVKLAEATTKNLLTDVYAKLSVHTRVEAVFRAHALGVLNVRVTAQMCHDRLMGNPDTRLPG